MTGGLGQRSRAPLDDTSRRRLFLAAVVVIALVAALALLDHNPQPTSGTPQPAVAPALPAGGVVVRTTPRQRSGSRSEVSGALRAARRFLAGYLPYSYGHGPAKTITAATGVLRDRLAVQPPRVSRQERRRGPRLRLLQADAVSGRDASVRALIADGAGAYTVELHVVWRATGWRVSDVGA